MNLDLTPRQVELVRGAIVTRMEDASEQIHEEPVNDNGRMGTLPDWVCENNAELRRDIATLERVLQKLNS